MVCEVGCVVIDEFVVVGDEDDCVDEVLCVELVG